METQKKEPTKIQRVLTGKYGESGLGVFSFAESSFLPVFTDPLVIAMVIAKPQRWFRYALIATVTSVLGGLFGYLIGAVFFETIGRGIVTTYGLEEIFQKTQAVFNGNAITFTLIGALTPLPYKLVAITGGLLKINVLLFVLASFVGRAIRFVAVAYITKEFGEHILKKMTWKYSLGVTATFIGLTVYSVMLIF